MNLREKTFRALGGLLGLGMLAIGTLMFLDSDRLKETVGAISIVVTGAYFLVYAFTGHPSFVRLLMPTPKEAK
jgi:hypothetical protein